MVCEKRTYLKRLFCKADSRNIVLEAGGQEQDIRVSEYQGIRKSGKRTKSGIQTSGFRPSTYVVGSEW